MSKSHVPPERESSARRKGPRDHRVGLALGVPELPEEVLVVDIGATKTVVSATRDDGLLPGVRVPTEQDPDRQVAAVAEAVAQLRGSWGVTGDVMAIGCPGPLDPTTGTIVEPPNLRQWWGYPLAERLSDRIGLPVALENDANLGALGEAVYGSGRDATSLYYITISTGIGASLVVDGKIFDGHRALAGEVYALDPGVFFGNPEGETLLERASGPGLVRSARRRLGTGTPSLLREDDLDTHDLFRAWDAGDRVAIETVEHGVDAMAGLVIAVSLIVAPDVVVLAGGLCTESRWFVDPIRAKVERWQTVSGLRDMAVRRAELWDQAVLYGAAELGRDFI